MEINQIIAQIADYGFPMALSWYLLVRMERRLDKLSDVIEKLSRTLAVKGS